MLALDLSPEFEGGGGFSGYAHYLDPPYRVPELELNSCPLEYQHTLLATELFDFDFIYLSHKVSGVLSSSSSVLPKWSLHSYWHCPVSATALCQKPFPCNSPYMVMQLVHTSTMPTLLP